MAAPSAPIPIHGPGSSRRWSSRDIDVPTPADDSSEDDDERHWYEPFSRGPDSSSASSVAALDVSESVISAAATTFDVADRQPPSPGFSSELVDLSRVSLAASGGPKTLRGARSLPGGEARPSQLTQLLQQHSQPQPPPQPPPAPYFGPALAKTLPPKMTLPPASPSSAYSASPPSLGSGISMMASTPAPLYVQVGFHVGSPGGAMRSSPGPQQAVLGRVSPSSLVAEATARRLARNSRDLMGERDLSSSPLFDCSTGSSRWDRRARSR